MPKKIDFQPIDFQPETEIDFQEQPKEKGYIDRLSEDWANRGKAIDAEFNAPWNPNMQGVDGGPGFARRSLNIAGNVAGAIGDPLVEGITSAYKTIMPQQAQTNISQAIGEVSNNPLYKPFLEGIARTAKENPETINAIESITNLASLPATMNAYKAIGETAKKAVASIPGVNPLRMYTSAVKPGTNVRKGMEAISEEMKYALDKGLMPNQSGLDAVQDTLRANRAQTVKAIAQHAGKTISPSDDAMRYIPSLIDEWAGPTGKAKLPQESKRIILKAANDFYQQNKNSGLGMNLERVDKLRGQLYKQESLYKAGSPRPRTEIEEFDKALARGLKDSLYDSVMDTHPQLRVLGEDSKLMIDLKNTFEAAAQRIGRRDLMGIGLPIKTGVGTVVGKVTGLPGLGTTVGIMAGVLDTPSVKAKLAIAINKARQKSLRDSLNNLSKTKLVGLRMAEQAMGGNGE